MFGLKYLSRENKLLLAKAQDRLTNNKNPKERADAELLVQELLAEAKPYLECDRQQMQELREQLITQIRTLEGMGKHQSAESFRLHLKDVDFHLQTLTMQAQLQEESRPGGVNEPPNISGDRLPSMNARERERRKQKASGRARWTVDMDEKSTEDN